MEKHTLAQIIKGNPSPLDEQELAAITGGMNLRPSPGQIQSYLASHPLPPTSRELSALVRPNSTPQTQAQWPLQVTSVTPPYAAKVTVVAPTGGGTFVGGNVSVNQNLMVGNSIVGVFGKAWK